MYTARVGGNNIGYNENYYTSRKKLLNDFLKDEETENMKYIEETENLVSQTKMFLKDLVSNQLDFESLNDQLEDIQTELETDCNIMQGELNTLQSLDKNIEKQINDVQKQEEQGTKDYMKKIEELKNELESKEFTIQNMERLYVELENIIKDNIQKGNEQLLTMEQFNDFLSQNEQLKNEIKLLEEEKNKLNKDYNQLLKENINLRSKDESFEVEKIKEVLDEIGAKGLSQKDAERKIYNLQNKNKKLEIECNNLKEKIKKLTNSLRGLNIDNQKFNNELLNIYQELYPKIKLNKKNNKSFEINENNIGKEESLIKQIKNNQIKI
jgi:chromosome segregation ATPase